VLTGRKRELDPIALPIDPQQPHPSRQEALAGSNVDPVCPTVANCIGSFKECARCLREHSVGGCAAELENEIDDLRECVVVDHDPWGRCRRN
jgi:hypothetical protein